MTGSNITRPNHFF